MTVTSEHLLPWLALMYWNDAPGAMRFDAHDIWLATWLADGTL